MSLGHGVLLIVGSGCRSSEQAVERRLKQMGTMPRIIKSGAGLYLAREKAAEAYRLVTEEEEIPGWSFVAFRRAATMLHLPALPATGAIH